jgi:hypothetical protein
MRKKLLLIATCLLAAPVHAETGDQAVFKPAEIASVIHAAAPYGTGTYTYFLQSIYDAALWTDAAQWSMQSPFALSLRYDIDIDKKILVDRSLDEMKRGVPLSDQQLDQYRTQLDILFTEIKSGDTLTALYIPGKNLRLYHNGELTGSTDNMAFARRFFDIWLSEHTSATDLRHELLAKTGN